MEKVIVTLRSDTADDEWAEQLCGPVAHELLALGLPGLTVNVRDADVRDSLMTLTTLDPPVQALVSMWTQQYYGDQLLMALELLGHLGDYIAAYLVTESAPLPPPPAPPGARSPGLANMALLRRPAEMDERTWLSRWHGNHTPVAIATQSTFGYVQNYVVRALTEDAPVINAIVEELFPIEAVGSLHAFFGAADDADLQNRMEQMVASTAAFGANVNIDAVPTSRYLYRSPFQDGPT
ncbi:EthD domain-containing protein [Mycobacterium sp. CVI_P3]|uniref:EthD domain-containing protein n=1 Tax=Mycobacterium pinniadriaticum TaxID=2994102 RepID=A0ABT3S954_9MYCO|nr:EthD domain-containing protein [Mycobacterium pinniadriaticum]MCX2929617.1 EthD domain-containing protein [Mycobacterium pinniadriaticum]MCX2936041.1 EthD domain-containing protein [Mycobacterium pinniadriaticum]